MKTKIYVCFYWIGGVNNIKYCDAYYVDDKMRCVIWKRQKKYERYLELSWFI